MLNPHRRRLRAAALCALTVATAAHAAAPEIVVTIAPVHSLVASVTRGVTEPYLMLDGSASPHHHALRPSQARALQSARLVVWVGPALESFLSRPVQSISDPGRVITLMTLPGIRVLPTRRGGLFEDHVDHEHPQTGTASPPTSTAGSAAARDDPHVWLDPGNAVTTVDAVAAALARIDPANAPRYLDNAAATRARIAALDADLRALLAPVTHEPYLVFHDAYHAFERHYGLHPAGAVTLNPQRAPGAARLRELRERIQTLGIACVFREPQFEPRLVETLINGTAARAGVLDPMGSGVKPGPDAWFSIMHNLATALGDCLSGQ